MHTHTETFIYRQTHIHKQIYTHAHTNYHSVPYLLEQTFVGQIEDLTDMVCDVLCITCIMYGSIICKFFICVPEVSLTKHLYVNL